MLDGFKKSRGPLAWTSKHSLPPSMTVPATPHPNPFEELLVLPTEDGLMLKSAAHHHPKSFVRISWGGNFTITEVSSTTSSVTHLDWHSALPIYGVIGVKKILACAYICLYDMYRKAYARF